MASLPRPVLIALGALLFVVVLTMILDSAIYYNKVHAGVSMGGQELAGKTRDEAIDLLTDRVEETRDFTVTLVRDSKSWTVTPDELGQEINIQASVEAAVDRTRSQNIISDLARRLRLYFNSDNLPLVGELDDEKLDAFLANIAGELDLKPVNAGLSVNDDSIRAVDGRSGFVVDQDLLRTQLTDALFTFGTAEIQVPMMTKAPDVLADSTSEAEEQVLMMLSDDLHLQYLIPKPEPVVTTTPSTAEGKTAEAPQTTTTTEPRPSTTTTLVETTRGALEFVWATMTFKPEDIIHYVDYKSEERNGVMTLVAYISGDKMSPVFSDIEDPMAIPAQNARFRANDFSFWIDDAKNGRALDYEATAAALTEAALSVGSRTAVAEMKDVEPDLTTEEAHAMGIDTELGRCSLPYEGTPPRQNNVRMATYYTAGGTDELYVDRSTSSSLTSEGELDGVLVAPGDEYNFAKLLGERVPERGFVKAPGIVDGTLEDVYGGGICQVSTTLFNAVLMAGLEVTERWNHSWFIQHYPEGKDATITAGGAPKNLRFVNNTPNYIWVYGKSDGIDTTFVIYGTDDGRVVNLDVSPRYDVKPNERIRWVENPNLPGDVSTTVVDIGQDAFKLTLTQTISWPSGSTTITEFISQWKIRPKTIEIPTSSTTNTTLPPSATTTTGGG